MKTKKIISFGLILVILVGCIAGCSDGSTPSGNSGDTDIPEDSTDAVQEETTAEAIKYVADYLPDKTYSGYEFRMVAPTDYDDAALVLNAEETTGNTIVDAVYKRNLLIEEKYNINFKQIDVPDYPSLTSTFQKSTLSASDDFDLCMLISRDAWSMALTGAVVPVDKLPYLDISQPWYSHDVNSEISINGKLYFAYSDECLNMFGSAVCVLFNKKIVEDLALGDMYTIVNEGKWTTDNFFTFAAAATMDMDGDGVITETDRFGIVSQCDFLFPSLWVCGGIKTISKDENDLLIFTGDNEKLYDALEKAHRNLFGGEKIYYDSFLEHKFAEEERLFTRKQFEGDSALYYVTGVGNISSLREMDTDFGILPFPKYDEAQEKYYSRVIDGWINCVPNFTSDLERTSVIMEALAVESKNITVPAYFETALRTKYARDNESQEMLDIIHANRTVDLGDTFYMATVRNIYMSEMNAKSNNFASAVAKNTKLVNKTLQKDNETAQKIQE